MFPKTRRNGRSWIGQDGDAEDLSSLASSAGVSVCLRGYSVPGLDDHVGGALLSALRPVLLMALCEIGSGDDLVAGLGGVTVLWGLWQTIAAGS